MEQVRVGLCKGRHDMPVDGYIFTEEINPTDFGRMHQVFMQWLVESCGVHVGLACAINQADDTSIRCFTGKKQVILYVTGLSAALAEVIRMCAMNGVMLTLMHYNRETGEYVPQRIF